MLHLAVLVLCALCALHGSRAAPALNVHIVAHTHDDGAYQYSPCSKRGISSRVMNCACVRASLYGAGWGRERLRSVTSLPSPAVVVRKLPLASPHRRLLRFSSRFVANNAIHFRCSWVA